MDEEIYKVSQAWTESREVIKENPCSDRKQGSNKRKSLILGLCQRDNKGGN